MPQKLTKDQLAKYHPRGEIAETDGIGLFAWSAAPPEAPSQPPTEIWIVTDVQLPIGIQRCSIRLHSRREVNEVIAALTNLRDAVFPTSN
jgi:hypothetical protein